MIVQVDLPLPPVQVDQFVDENSINAEAAAKIRTLSVLDIRPGVGWGISSGRPLVCNCGPLSVEYGLL